MTEMVTIEDSTILTMIRDARFAEIPCLANKADVFATRGASCGSCARKRQQRQRQEMARIKSCLAALAPDKKARLKQLLDTRKVRVTYIRSGDNEVVQLTF